MKVIYEKQIVEDVAGSATVELATSALPAEVLYLQITGTATAMSLQVMGASSLKASADDEFATLASINMSTYEVSQTVSSMGIYAFAVDSCHNVKVVLSAVNGGSVSVYARTVVGG